MDDGDALSIKQLKTYLENDDLESIRHLRSDRQQRNRFFTSKANILVFVGLISALILLVVVSITVGKSSYTLWNPNGLFIVVGGTIVSMLIAFRAPQLHMLLCIPSILFWKNINTEREMAQMLKVIHAHSRHGVREAEKERKKLSNDFVSLGVQLVLDGIPFDDLVHALSWRLQKLHERDFADAHFFRTLALFSQAFGMFGTVLGLIAMLQELWTYDLKLIGQSMAVALVTTFYGLCLGYIVFRPLAIRVEQNSVRKIAQLNVLMQGILMFSLGRGYGTIEEAMRSLLEGYQSAYFSRK